MAKPTICQIEHCGKPASKRGWCNVHYKRWWRYGDPITMRRIHTHGDVVCLTEGCENLARIRGRCKSHHGIWLRSLKPGRGTQWGEPLKYVREIAINYAGEECLIWPFWRANDTGYAKMLSAGRGSSEVYVHRIVCALVYGPPPTPRHVAAHSCNAGHLGCIAPKHLRWATQKENIEDAVMAGSFSRKKRKVY